MDYELAKELKEAGFREKICYEGYWLDADTKERCGAVHGAIYVPTLEELIEACGDNMLKLIRQVENWYAVSLHYEEFTGATPTEAIARLWLALNKKV